MFFTARVLVVAMHPAVHLLVLDEKGIEAIRDDPECAVRRAIGSGGEHRRGHDHVRIPVV